MPARGEPEAAQKAAQQAHATRRTKPQAVRAARKKTPVLPEFTSDCDSTLPPEVAGTGREQTPKPPGKTQFPNPALQNAVQLHPTRQSGPKMTLNCVSLLRPGGRSVWNFGWPSWRSCGPAWRHAQIIYKAVYQAAPMMNSQIATIRFLHGQEATWRPRRVAPAQTR